ncbi:MAG: sensor histidine kinase [Deltaproteobacteria bacterium]|nr:sensor histidine kinase [Deltaproteobacteria bacterium]
MDVQAAAARITQNPIVDHLLRNYGGLLAVLNEHRQILTVNHQMLSMLGVDDARQVLGLRPGEAVDCDHAWDHEGGCGTSPFCATCGAAIAIVVCQKAGSSDYRECVLDCRIGGQPITLDLRVQASGIEVAGQTFVLLYLQDVSSDKRRAAVERAFFHDINNLLASLMGTVELLASHSPEVEKDHANQARSLVLRVAKELKVQRALSTERPGAYRVQLLDCEVEPLVDQVQQQLMDHPAGKNKHIVVGPIAPAPTVRTDPFLLMRILTNMLINALEATAEGGEVTIEAAADGAARVFTVWNATAIPEAVAMRVFQRYFSTKGGAGRGVGTYSMKLFGEEYLGGTVGFTTDESAGTSFFLRLPAVPDAEPG